MPIHIDRMDTSIDITGPTAAPASAGERRPTTTTDPAARDVVRELVGDLMRDELERFLRNRGM